MGRARCLFLVASDESAGLGHLRRTLVLADALREAGATCSFALSDVAAAPRVAAAGHDASAWDLADPHLPRGFDVVVVDAYDFPPRLLRELGGSAIRVVIDDLADRPVEAEIVVNHNLYGGDCDYSAFRADRVLAGPEYALVSPAFRALADVSRPDPPHVLISFGATDAGDRALAVAQALCATGAAMPIDVAVMQCSPRLEAALRSCGARVHCDRRLEELMGMAAVYVGGGGFTVMEATAAGLAVVACAISANQRLNVAAADRIGIVAFRQFDATALARAALDVFANGPPAVRPTDGRGAQRIARSIMDCFDRRAG